MDTAMLSEACATALFVQSWETQGTKPDPFPNTYGSHLPHGFNIITGGEVSTGMVTATEHPHIVRDPSIGRGEPIIRNTGIRVRILVEYWRLDTPPQELLQYFPHLTLAQVLDALSYYEDHQEEINILINLNRPDNTSDQSRL
jgi:uncharacterized protein (DUF433 family)